MSKQVTVSADVQEQANAAIDKQAQIERAKVAAKLADAKAMLELYGGECEADMPAILKLRPLNQNAIFENVAKKEKRVANLSEQLRSYAA